MRFDRHAYPGRDDDRDDPGLRTHDPRAGYGQPHGLRDDPDLYVQRSPDVGYERPYDDTYAAQPQGSLDTGGPTEDRRRPQWMQSRTGRLNGRGLGPRTYRRRDERIYEDVCEALATDDELDVSDVEVEVHDGEVTLRGYCVEREQKWRIEDVCREIAGVVDVRNHLRPRHRPHLAP